MNEQMILWFFIVIAATATTWLGVLKSKKQRLYKGDERWQLIQLKANNTANLANAILLVLLAVLPFLVNNQATFTLQRVSIFALIYLGGRNLIELAATIYFDKQL